MITNIKLENFRAFQKEVSVRIRPITALVGRNSAGKSSLLKFLLMLRQTLDSQSESFFVTEGRHVQLGIWRDNRNTRTREAAMKDSYFRYAIEIESEELPNVEVRELWRASSRSNLVTELADRFLLHAELPKQPVRLQQPKGRFLVGGRVYYGREFRYGRHDVECFLGDHSVFKQSATNLQRVGFLRFGQRDDSLNGLLSSATAERFLEPLRHEILSQRHLSPIREESQQTIQTGSPPPNDVGHRGEYAIPHLARMFTRPERREQADFVDRFATAVADVDRIRFSSQVARLLTQAKARNRLTQAFCSLADFGFGVSQCLPIFVQGAMQVRGQLLLVEQPEAQLHPTAQLELGTFFAELWNEREVPTIIETHSANIILRLRRLISKGKLAPSDVSLAYFHVTDVPQKRGKPLKAVAVKNLDINPDGSLEKGLPMEFFGADIQEALDFGEASE
jgi:predicted ATPase